MDIYGAAVYILLLLFDNLCFRDVQIQVDFLTNLTAVGLSRQPGNHLQQQVYLEVYIQKMPD